MGEVIHGEYGRSVNGEMLHSVTNYELHKALYSGHNDHNYFEIAHNVKRLESVEGLCIPLRITTTRTESPASCGNQTTCSPYTSFYSPFPGSRPCTTEANGGSRGGTGNLTGASPLFLFLKDMEQKTGPITDHIAALARIHRDNSELHDGTYKELLLTNRQYAFGRLGENTMILSAVNNDSQPAALSIPVPFPASQAINLLDGEAPSIPVENGRLSVTLPPSGGAIFKLREA